MTWDQLVGPWTAAALAALLLIGVASSIRREVGGAAPRRTTLATSRPVWGSLLAITALGAGALVVLRLGYLS